MQYLFKKAKGLRDYVLAFAVWFCAGHVCDSFLKVCKFENACVQHAAFLPVQSFVTGQYVTRVVFTEYLGSGPKEERRDIKKKGKA